MFLVCQIYFKIPVLQHSLLRLNKYSVFSGVLYIHSAGPPITRVKLRATQINKNSMLYLLIRWSKKKKKSEEVKHHSPTLHSNSATHDKTSLKILSKIKKQVKIKQKMIEMLVC